MRKSRRRIQVVLGLGVALGLILLAGNRALGVGYCGGASHASVDGTSWSEDRFFVFGTLREFGVRPFEGEIDGTEEDGLYRTLRWFPRGEGFPAGYRIPLHFAETELKEPGGRAFVVVLEGQQHLGGDDFAANPGTAFQKTASARVADGFLDLGFLPIVGNPYLAALEVSPEDERDR